MQLKCTISIYRQEGGQLNLESIKISQKSGMCRRKEHQIQSVKALQGSDQLQRMSLREFPTPMDMISHPSTEYHTQRLTRKRQDRESHRAEMLQPQRSAQQADTGRERISGLRIGRAEQYWPSTGRPEYYWAKYWKVVFLGRVQEGQSISAMNYFLFQAVQSHVTFSGACGPWNRVKTQEFRSFWHKTKYLEYKNHSMKVELCEFQDVL